MKISKKDIIIITIIVCTYALVGIVDFLLKGNESSILYDDYENIMIRKELRVVLVGDAIEYYIYKANPMGFQLELFEDFANEHKFKLKVIGAKSYAEAQNLLKNAECDIIVRHVDDDENDNISIPIFQSEFVCVSNSKEIKQTDTIYVSSGIIDVDEFSDVTNAQIVEIDTLSCEKILRLVINKKISATLCSQYLVNVYRREYKMNVIPDIKLAEYVVWEVNPQAKVLLDSVNGWITRIKDTKHFKAQNKLYLKSKKAVSVSSNLYSGFQSKISSYDILLKKYSKNINWDWRLLASLVYEESRFNKQAKSYSGAYGLMQLMPIIYSKYMKDSTHSADGQINAGVKYISFLYKKMPLEIKDSAVQIKFVLSSYNAGMGHVEDAMRLSEKYHSDPYSWENISYYLKRLSESKYYRDSVVKHGQYRGLRAFEFTTKILHRYEHYKNLIED